MKASNLRQRLISLLLAFVTLFGIVQPAFAADSLTGSTSVTIHRGVHLEILGKSTGGTIGGSTWTYQSNDGITGPAYCVNWGLKMPSASKRLTIEPYSRTPQTMGVFVNGYPMRTLSQFKDLHPDIPGIANLTESEFAYATQLAVWASCGQLKVNGTPFSAGRATLVEPTSDAQKIRVYRSVVEILKLCQHWTKHLKTGMYFHMEENQLGSSLSITDDRGLAGAAEANAQGIKKETINGKEYYTRQLYVDSATSNYDYGYVILLYSVDTPSGTIFTDTSNNVLNTRQQWGATMYELPTPQSKVTTLNSNGEAYGGTFKICMPCESVTDSGKATIRAYTNAAQMNLFLAYNPNSAEQSYIVADPAYIGIYADADISWNQSTTTPGTASLRIQKTDGGNMPLEGAEFTITGSKGTVLTGTSDQNGYVEWIDLPADETFELVETKAPAGFSVVAPRNITLTEGESKYVTIQDDVERGFTVKKIDAQNGSTIEGALFEFEQIDGTYKTTGVTGFDGMIKFEGDELPFGSYRVTEKRAPNGYELDTHVETVKWDGTKDVTITFQDVRKPTVIVSKMDGVTGISLPNTTFRVYKDGKLIDSVTTNDAGEVRLPIEGEGYYEFEEIIVPEGYVLDPVRHGIHIDPYDPQTKDDPVLTIKNYNKPGLRILKIDKQSGDPMPGITFKIYKDNELFDTKTTDGNGEIVLFDLEPGTYRVEEVITDDEHVLNPAPQEIELRAGQQEIVTLTFDNSKKPGMRMVKKDSVTMKPLPNVRFEIKKVGGSFKQEYTTDENGKIDLSKLEPGAYEVTELEAPDGYLIDNAKRIIQLNPDETAEFIFTNTPKPDLELLKYDPNTGKYLPGATFRIAKIEDGSHYLDRITDMDGRIYIEDLEPGVYSVTEIDPPPGYVKIEQEFHVELSPGKVARLVVDNEAKPDLKIIKQDAVTGKPVAGVTFTIKKPDSSTITTEATDENGEIFIEDLDPGVIEVWEQSVPDGYILDTEHQMVTLVPNRTATVHFKNYQKPKLTISKVDIEGKPLTGALFEVKTKAGVKIGDFPVDAKGQIQVPSEHLAEGYYIITEKQAPTGYILDPTPHEVYLRPGRNTEVSIENEKKPGLTIKKIDSVVGDGVKGAKFEIWVAKDKNQNGTYQKLNENYYYTDENGIIHIDNLDTGWYMVKEVEPPTGYMLKEPSEQTIYVEHDKTAVVTFENIPKSGLIIRKIDADTGKPLANAWFRIRYLGGTSGSGGTIIGEYQTSSNGNIILTDLDAGTYIVEEINAPDGYVIDIAPQTAYISGYEQDCITLTFTNSKNGALLIKKIDSLTKAPLSDVRFFVTTSDGTVVGNGNGYFTTDAAGTILVGDIEPGTTLVVKEVETRPGYILDDLPQTVKIKSNETVTLEFRNQPKGGLIVRKIDSATGKPIAGVEFKITNANGELLPDNEGLTSSNGMYTTDGNGQIVLSKLSPGTYIVTETKTLDDYILDATPQTVVVNASDTQTLTFRNTPKGALVVWKYDSVTGEAVKNAVFQIKNITAGAGGNVVGTYTTTANGSFTVTGLDAGTYVVEEIASDSGHVIDASPQTVNISGDKKEVIQLYFGNAPKGNLLIKKIDDVTHEPISGVEFLVTNSDGTTLGTSGGRYTTDSAGSILVEGIAPGTTLIAKETRAKGNYVLDDTPQTATIKAGQTVELEFRNQPYGGLTIVKKDGVTGEVLPGVKFKITTSNGELVPDNGGATSSNGLYTTDENGQIALKTVKPGTYVVTETDTIPGYVMDAGPQTVVVEPGDHQTLTFTNTPKGGLVVKKMDSVTREPLPDVIFKVTRTDGSVVGTSNGEFRTDARGFIYIPDIEPGGYVVWEVKAKSGYVLDDTPKTVEIKDHQTYTLEFFNDPYGGLTIIKKDSVTGKFLQGVEFKVTDANGEPVANNGGSTTTNGYYRTDVNGQITINTLKPGVYFVTETKTIEGYRLDAEPQSVVVKAGDIQTITMTNTPLGGLLVKKMDSVTREPLSGVTFKITRTDGTVVGTSNGEFVTDENGYISLPDIEPGSYIVREVQAKPGYLLDGTPKAVEIKDHQTYTLDFYNQPLGGLVIRKLDSISKKPLAGVEFKITTGTGEFVPNDDGMTSSNGIFVTDANGEIHVKTLKPGTYVITETAPLPGYTMDDASRTVAVAAGDTQTITFTNTPTTALVIQKFIEGTDNEPMAGVEFLVTNGTGAGVGRDNGRFVTDKTGRILISDLEDGTNVTAREVKTLDGFILDGSPQSIQIKAGEVQTLTFWNKRDCSLTILKQGTDKTPLTGAVFHVTDEDGAAIGTNNGRYTTDRNGLITITGLQPGQVLIVTEEKAPNGYVKDATPKTIKIKEGVANSLTFENAKTGTLIINKRSSVDKKTPLEGVTFKITTTGGSFLPDADGKISSNGLYYTDENGQIILNSVVGSLVVTEMQSIDGYTISDANRTQTVEVAPDDTQTLYFYNDPLCSLTITKLDSVTGKPVPGTEFTIKDGNGNVLGRYTTGTDGTVTVTGLQPNSTVVVTETKVPTGYVLNSTPQTIIVKNGTGNSVVSGTNASITSNTSGNNGNNDLTFTNDPTTTLVIQKYVDGTENQPLKGVEFLVTDSSGKVVGPNNGYFYTDKDGRISISNLEPGITVTARETKTLAGYVLDGTPQSVQIKAGKSQSLTFWNKKAGSLTIKKVDSITKKPLAGIQFKVAYADGSVVDNANGTVSSKEDSYWGKFFNT